jgi:hypothetical protein
MQANGGRQERSHERIRITTAPEAQDLVDGVMSTLGTLAHVIGEETQLMREGQINAALSLEPRKTDLAGQYMRGLEIVKANAVALARFAPQDVQRLKGAHTEFTDILETNQAVLATARAVSETIVRDLAKESGRTAQPQGYGRTGYGSVSAPQQRQSAGPIVVSKKL